jgi:hypothetical protein
MTEQEKKKKIALYENMIKKAEGDPSKASRLKEQQIKLDEVVAKPQPTPDRKSVV